MVVAMHEFNLPPPWLREVAEHELLAVDADTLAAHTHLPAEVHRRSYWIKVSSFRALHSAVAASSADVQAELGTSTTPLCVFLMPTKLFARREARSRELTTRLTLLGYAPPAAPADGHGDGAGNAN